MEPFLIINLILVLLVGLFLIFYRPIVLGIEKKAFHYNVSREVYRIAKDNDFYLLNKVALQLKDGKVIHFDHLLFGDKFIYCIGANYYSIAINGKFNDSSWFKYRRNNKIDIIKNPMRLHRARVNYLSKLFKSSPDLFLAIVIVNDSCLLPEYIDEATAFDKIINLKTLKNLIKDHEKRKDITPMNQEGLQQMVNIIYENGVEK